MFDRRFQGTQKLAPASVQRMMRRYRVTIKSLAEHMQITQKRVREVRTEGVHGETFVQDWIEGIETAPKWDKANG